MLLGLAPHLSLAPLWKGAITEAQATRVNTRGSQPELMYGCAQMRIVQRVNEFHSTDLLCLQHFSNWLVSNDRYPALYITVPGFPHRVLPSRANPISELLAAFWMMRFHSPLTSQSPSKHRAPSSRPGILLTLQISSVDWRDDQRWGVSGESAFSYKWHC